MKTNRLEAFSDGVMAILITIMVLELKAPHDPTPASLAASELLFESDNGEHPVNTAGAVARLAAQ